MNKQHTPNKKPTGKWTKSVLPIALTGALAGDSAHHNNIPENSPQYATAENLPALQQVDVDKEYARIYTEIKAAKEAAEKAGKKLMVLVGENHVSGASYLRKLIIADIMRRLDVKDMIREQSSENILEKLFMKYQPNSKVSMSSLGLLVDLGADSPNPDPQLVALKPVMASEEAVDYIGFATQLLFHPRRDDEARRKTSDKNWQPSSSYEIFNRWEFTSHLGDIERYDREQLPKILAEINSNPAMSKEEAEKKLEKITRDRHDPIVENAMVKAVHDFPEHAVAVYGRAHLPYIIDHLQLRPDQALLAYDIAPDSIPPHLIDKLDPQFAARNKRAQQLVESGVVKTITLDGSELTYESATQMVLLASMQQRAQCGEVNRETAELFRIGLPMVVEQLMNSSNQSRRR